MPHRIKHFEVREGKRYYDSDGFGVLVFVSWGVASLCLGAGLFSWINWWWFLGVIPGLVGVLWVCLMVSHETELLSESDKKIYLSYKRLSEESRNNLPPMMASLLGQLTELQKSDLVHELNQLHKAEADLREQERSLNPAARELIEALQMQKNLTLEKVQIVKDMKELS